jgi:uncharacterized protein YajQ (UPF0234 family)
MPSFDVVSEIDMHELTNAVDQTNREIANRFDFKGVDAKVKQEANVLTLQAQVEFQLKQMMDMLVLKLTKRGIDVEALEEGKVQETLNRATQIVTVRRGIESDLARKMVKTIKDSKMKVQAAIQGDKLRVTGKKRDDLQKVMALLREAKVGLPLQFVNYRD